MSVIWADPGGEYYFSLGATVHYTLIGAPTLISTGNFGRQAATDGKIYAIQIGQNVAIERVFPVSYSHLITGWAVYIPTATFTNGTIFFTYENNTSDQMDAKVDASGHVLLTRNGTVLVTSTAVLTAGWNYLEYEVIFATGATGTAVFRLNQTTIATIATVQTATTVATANRIKIGQVNGVGGSNHQIKDIYVLDASTSPNVAFLGDITVACQFSNGAGASSQFASNVGPFTLSSVNTTGVYQGTITGGGSNAYVGKKFTITGFANGANNQSQATCTSSTATALTLGGTTVTETLTASAAFLAGGAGMVSDGLTHLGTWPDGDTTYVASSTPNDISDFAHETLSLTGSIISVVHISYVRADVGTSTFRQYTKSGATAHTNGADLNATTSYLYYFDYMDVDPNTSAAWTLANYNAATDGLKKI